MTDPLSEEELIVVFGVRGATMVAELRRLRRMEAAARELFVAVEWLK